MLAMVQSLMMRLFEWEIHKKGVDEKGMKRRLTSKKLADKGLLSREVFSISDIALIPVKSTVFRYLRYSSPEKKLCRY